MNSINISVPEAEPRGTPNVILEYHIFFHLQQQHIEFYLLHRNVLCDEPFVCDTYNTVVIELFKWIDAFLTFWE